MSDFNPTKKILSIETKKLSLPFTQQVATTKSQSIEAIIIKAIVNQQVQNLDLCAFTGLSKTNTSQLIHDIKKYFSDSPTDPGSKAHIEYLNYMIHNYDEICSIKNNKLKSNTLLKIDNITNFNDLPIKGVIKLKVRSSSLSKVLPLLSYLNDKKSKLLLRIDANASLNTDELTKLWKEVKKRQLTHYIDYFEEPLSNFNEYPSIIKELSIPIALDENYLMAKELNIRTIVFKPSQYPISDLQKIAANHRIIISSAFDPNTSYLTCVHFAYNIAPNEYHGLSARTQYE